METSIRELYEQIFHFEGIGLFESVLKPWTVENHYRTYLATLSEKLQVNQTGLSQEDLWELYALSRVLDLLTLGFQPNNRADGSDWTGTDITLAEYNTFNDLLGLETNIPELFHPFASEIMEAQEGETDFQITEHYFPAVKLNNLMIKRAGVKIILNPQQYDLNLVNTAAIYWTHRRKNRPYHDLAQGWGSNSQWRTNLRMDIETETHYIYNIRGEFDLTTATPAQKHELWDLELQEAIELTRFRHFIQSTTDDSDLFPYDFRYAEKKADL
jgi:hypothetical protein